MKPSIVFFLMGLKGLRTLQSICEEASLLAFVDSVIIAQDKSVQNDYYFEIKLLCNKYQIKNYDRLDSFFIEQPYAIAISWRWLIELPHSQLIVLHDSLLPKYRGFNPLVTCLLKQERQIGVTALFATEEYDKGAILAQSKANIVYPIKIQEVIEKICDNYVEVVHTLLQKIGNQEKLVGMEQNEHEASYSLWRDEQDYRINWHNESAYIKRFIDAVGYPYQGASAVAGNTMVRIWEAEEVKDLVVEDREKQIGKVIFYLEQKPVVVCGKGLLKIISMTSNGNAYQLTKFRTRFQ